jgi:hypothetical protein
MDCLEAQAILSAAHDGEIVDPADREAAELHCGECADCAAFTAGLRYLDVMPAPPVPPEVLAATLAAVSAAAEERAETLSAEAAETASAGVEPASEVAQVEELAPAPRRLPWLSDNARWAGIGAVGAVAATALIAFVIVGSGIVGPNRSAGTASTAQPPSQATDGATLSHGAQAPSFAGQTPATPQQSTVPITVPDYVAYKGLVYTPGSLLADSSTATPTIGTVTTAFAAAGAPQSVPVYRSPLTDGSIVIKGPDGYRLYSPVIRMMQSQRYQLATGGTLERFGIWPTLPPQFTAPTSADGSPSFSTAGIDALGVRVYAGIGQPVTSGFAVAPGTSATDPAAGNPNWTWWQPVTQ